MLALLVFAKTVLHPSIGTRDLFSASREQPTTSRGSTLWTFSRSRGARALVRALRVRTRHSISISVNDLD